MGKVVYAAQCQSCHQANGEGQLQPTGDEYLYPPLWGKHSYNDGAGLYRLSNFAKYIKYNMPLGATHTNTILTDEQAWDLAAFVNSSPRPHKDVPYDWPDISKKPFDHPFGPYADDFSEKQHKYGPFKPITEAQKKRSGSSTKVDGFQSKEHLKELIAMRNNRRIFIKQLGVMGGAGLLASTPIASVTAAANENFEAAIPEENEPFTVSILQTTDVHCQVHPHDELFWENEQAVFRKTGGYAQLASYLKKERKKNPATF